MFCGYDLVKQEVPEHLGSLREMLNSGQCCISDVDDAAYAAIAFKLMKVVNGDKEACKDVSEYIQQQHRELKQVKESQKHLIKELASWLYWAANWTMRKPKATT